MSFVTIARDMLSKLNPSGDMEQQTVSFKLQEKTERITSTVANVLGKHYSFMPYPEFYLCETFFANCSFSNMCSTQKGIEHYNRLNPAKPIRKFTNRTELFEAIEKLKNTQQ